TALALSDGSGNWPAFSLVLASITLTILGFCVRWKAATPRLRIVFYVVLGAAWLGALVGLWSRPPAYYMGHAPSFALFRGGVVSAAAIVASYTWRKMPLGRLRFPALVSAFVFLSAWTIVTTPKPHIDVWYFQQDGAALLWTGHNPYDRTYPNIYGP